METNIYKTPKSDLNKENRGILLMPRLSAWYVFFLSLITLYLFAIYWMYDRSKRLNDISIEKQVSPFLYQVFAVFWLATFALEVTSSVSELGIVNESWYVWSTLISNLGILVWAFSMRYVLRWVLLKENLSEIKVSGLLTFLFGPFYLAYKINQAIDLAAQSNHQPDNILIG